MISRRLQVVIALLVIAILGMTFYLIHLKRKAESIGNGPAPQPLTAPISGPEETMTLYTPRDSEDAITPVSVVQPLPSDPGERARLALHALIARSLQKDSEHPLGAGADVHDVFLLDPTSAVVNLNAAFADTHPSGVETEQLSIFSLVLTLKAQLPEITRVRFLVEGKQRETLAGHLDLSNWFDVAAVSQATRELK